MKEIKSQSNKEKIDIRQFNKKAQVIITKALQNGTKLTETLNKIDYMYINQSLKQKRWINRSVMERRDQIRFNEQQK